MKTGRNEPCPCGSGRKYKRCCLSRDTVASRSPDERAWRRVRRAVDGALDGVLEFMVSVYGPAALDEAWHEFMLWDDDARVFDEQALHAPVFLRWALHCWSPNPDETVVMEPALHEVPPTQAYLEREGDRLDPLLRSYLQSCLARPLGFYEVERCNPGHGMALRDLLTGEEHGVHERMASRGVKSHDIIYVQPVHAGGVTMLEAIAPIVLPPGDKVAIIELRQRLQRRMDTAAASMAPAANSPLRSAWDLDLRELYLALIEPRLHPTLPELRTRDGDTWESHTLVFDIDSPQAAFDALRHLDPRADDGDALADEVIRDADGLLERAHLDWIDAAEREDGTCSVFGDIHIEEHELTAHVTSRERAERFQAIVSEHLPIGATFRSDEVMTPEQMLADSDSEPKRPDVSWRGDPQFQAALVSYLEQHYEGWIDIPLPALGERTPAQAVRDADGREQVAALLDQLEWDNPGVPDDAYAPILHQLRERLGFEPAAVGSDSAR
jgi:hypothetical protein